MAYGFPANACFSWGLGKGKSLGREVRRRRWGVRSGTGPDCHRGSAVELGWNCGTVIEAKWCDTFSSVLLRITVAIRVLLCFYMNFELFFVLFCSVKNVVRILVWLYWPCDSRVIFTALILPVRGSVFFSSVFPSVLEFSLQRPFTSVVWFIPRYFWNYHGWDIFPNFSLSKFIIGACNSYWFFICWFYILQLTESVYHSSEFFWGILQGLLSIYSTHTQIR